MRYHFDQNFKNGIAGWYFSNEDLDIAYQKSGILMLDMEYGMSCRLNCDYCFRKDDDRDKPQRAERAKTLDDTNVKNIVNQAAKMGAKSIHFVGKGEPFEEEKFLSIVRYIHDKENVYGERMIPLIFTAGHVLGDDKLANDINPGKDGEMIVKELYDAGASIILKINSLNHIIQNEEVRRHKITYKDGTRRDFNYTQVRDEALERLIRAGFNKLEHNPTRLGTATVMLKNNYHELFHHYRYFRSLNIYPIINTVVPCGRTKNMPKVIDISPTEQQKVELWKKIYRFNIDSGIKYEGISSYVGGHICSQLGYAMYVNVFGEVFDCPSSTNPSLGNVIINGKDGEKLQKLWEKSSLKGRYYGCRDNGCPWRFEHSPAMIPKTLFREVHEYLKKEYPDKKDVQDFVPRKYYHSA